MVVSGGQTGVDRAGLDAAMKLGIETGGWCPAGRLAEDGTIPKKYNTLTETDSRDVSIRTKLNVRESDATLILNLGPVEGGTKYTIELAEKYKKPHLVARFDAAVSMRGVAEWLRDIDPAVLNIAGPKESGRPGIHDMAQSFLLDLCQWVACNPKSK